MDTRYTAGRKQEGQQGPAQDRDEAKEGLFSYISQLEAVFDTITDGVFLFDTGGRILRMNKAARGLLGIDDLANYTALPLAERGSLAAQRYVQEQSPPLTAWATTRVLNGEVLTDKTAVEFTIHNRHGQTMRLNLSGAPIRDQHGNIVGAINICRDVTDRWKLEQRTQETLYALLSITQIPLLLPQDSDKDHALVDTPTTSLPTSADAVGWRLADLTCRILDCRRVSLITFALETGDLRPLAVIGLSPEEEQQWRREIGQICLDDLVPSSLFAHLQAGDVVRTKSCRRESSDLLPFGMQEVCIAPMQLGTRLIGVLSFDYGETTHLFTPEEEALAGAIAKLATLAIERERFLREMAAARAGALASPEITQQIDEFLGILAHELRAPLNNIQGFAQTLLVQTALGRGPQLAAWQEKALADLDLVAAHLNELIDDLLDLARLRIGQMELSPEKTDLIPLVQRVITQQQQTTIQHTLSFSSSTEPLVRDIDPRRIERVAGNLLSNAIKYSPEGGLIEVRMVEESEQQEVLLTVRDHGIGIPTQQQEQIFQQFVRAENARAYGIEGIGLGLYLCRTLIERHGGRIWCESIEGQGSTFFVAFPSEADGKDFIV